MNIKIALDPVTYSEKNTDWQIWQREFIDFEPTKDSWFHKLKSNSMKVKKGNETYFMDSVKTCPSFINGFKNRILIRNVADLNVSQANKTIKFSSSHPAGETCHINFHSSEQLGTDFPFLQGMLKNPVKFVSPFWFSFSQTADVIFNPVWWDKSTEFVQAIPGVIRVPKNTPIALNVNTFVKIPEENKQYCIQKGMPIGQLLIAEVKTPKLFFVKSLSKKSVDNKMNEFYKGLSTRASTTIRRYLIK